MASCGSNRTNDIRSSSVYLTDAREVDVGAEHVMSADIIPIIRRNRRMIRGSSFSDVRERARTTRTLDDPDSFFSTEVIRESPPVMVIDDSLAVRRVVEISLLRVGIPAISFPDGLAAMGALKGGDVAPPRVLLLDIGLPRMNGYELARTFRSNPAFAQTRIVMLSGHDGLVNRTYARMVGASDFIAKPFRSGELVRRVRVALGLVDNSPEWPR